MNAGHFNRRIRIERRDGRADAWGQPLEAWVTVADLWAAVAADPADAGQRLLLDSGLPASIRRQRFQVRLPPARRAGITVGMRIVHDGHTFDITGVAPDHALGQTAVLFTEQRAGTA
ncbi:head-tail adaptor protein [Stenotrophomonas sp. 24(2023)]|uniref:head-tail adaptor protein n=1 Tax=Stenotrophomonas sp. 24(2023) TaxID=3068324 RepID=UPI0027E06428|nr:head-tail adaptor protein [Stenotrophomonas sp. 24(2023)]WMJ71309.1 head-tail adaptor protein [Stenotrophomonas sp. 24(2023)]